MYEKFFLSTLLTFSCVVFILSISLTNSYDFNNKDIDEDDVIWEAYKKKYNKFYSKTSFTNKLIESMRKRIFNHNEKLIESFNNESSKKFGYELGINHLSDWFQSEIKQLYGYKPLMLDKKMNQIKYSNKRRRRNRKNTDEAEEYLDKILSNDVAVPSSIDWRKISGRVTPVKDQGFCSSCWAFATTGVLEGQLMVRNESLKKINSFGLSEQNLIDCSKGNCDGGTMQDAMIFIREENGIDNDNYYPYVGVENDCKFDRDEVAITDSGAAFLTEGDEQELKAVVAKFGPVSVAIDSDSEFAHYKSGVFYSNVCSNSSLDANHGVLVVGYDTDSKYGDYWIVKNSWSSDWGIDGYINMARNRDNNCGIASSAIIPTF